MLGNVLGGASGFYTSSKRDVVDCLFQRSRFYLFSNTLATSIAGASLEVLDLVGHVWGLRAKFYANDERF